MLTGVAARPRPPRSAGKNEKVVHRKEKREAWTCVAPLYRPGYASQDVSPEESEAASSAGGSELGSPHQQVGAGALEGSCLRAA